MTIREGIWPTPGGNTAHFLWRDDAIDWNTIESICRGPYDIARERHQDEYHLPSGLDGWAFDLGAYVGAAAVCLALDNPDMRIIAVEPVPENIRMVRANCALNGVSSRVTVLDGAVGVGEVYFDYVGTPDMPQVLQDAAPWNRYVANAHGVTGRPCERRKVRCYSLPELVAMCDGPVRLCKIDVEGGEWDFFASGDVGLIDTWTGEWHHVPGHTEGPDGLHAIFDATHQLTIEMAGFRAVRK